MHLLPRKAFIAAYRIEIQNSKPCALLWVISSMREICRVHCPLWLHLPCLHSVTNEWIHQSVAFSLECVKVCNFMFIDPSQKLFSNTNLSSPKQNSSKTPSAAPPRRHFTPLWESEPLNLKSKTQNGVNF
jgi:hypothetical protein